jgi:hypothetical protein
VILIDDDGKHPPSADDAGNPTVNFHGEKRCNRTHVTGSSIVIPK